MLFLIRKYSRSKVKGTGPAENMHVASINFSAYEVFGCEIEGLPREHDSSDSTFQDIEPALMVFGLEGAGDHVPFLS